MTCTLPAKMRELSVLLPRTDVIHLIETHPKILSTNIGSAVSAHLARRLLRTITRLAFNLLLLCRRRASVRALT
jgi:hypothetical protein